jgi:hypothetical protein
VAKIALPENFIRQPKRLPYNPAICAASADSDLAQNFFAAKLSVTTFTSSPSHIGLKSRQRASCESLTKQAREVVFGYSIGLDISDRDLQRSEKQFSRCKSFDTYTPFGPFVYSGIDVRDLPIELRQNGELRQSARTIQMIYPVAELISFSSRSMTLNPGDVILTGTPSGVGPIHAGDELEARVGDWPLLRVHVGKGGRLQS